MSEPNWWNPSLEEKPRHLQSIPNTLLAFGTAKELKLDLQALTRSFRLWVEGAEACFETLGKMILNCFLFHNLSDSQGVR